MGPWRAEARCRHQICCYFYLFRWGTVYTRTSSFRGGSVKSSVLVVAVRGWTTPGDRLLGERPGGEFRTEFLAELEQKLGGNEVWAPDLDMSMFSMRPAESLSQELFDKIDTKLAENPGIEHIVLLGYSSGSLLARRVFCMAHGADDSGMLSRPAATWAAKIDRLVMISGITRGWEFSSASPAHIRFLGPLLLFSAKLVGWWRNFRAHRADAGTIPFIWQLKRGSPFVITTRIQYINVLEALRAAPKSALPAPLRIDGLPSTVFLLGATDEFISPADCTEMGPRLEFAFIELPNSNHGQAIQICGESVAEQCRSERLVAAIRDDFAALIAQPWAIPASDIDDYSDPMDISENHSNSATSPQRVEHAVIVVHGIRDSGFWTKRVAREIKTLGRKHSLVVRAPTPTYGYFSMWDFIKPGGREEAAYWFMERYADVRTHFPHAKISFIGHSNGTYIAARALELCQAIHFENVVFAGSVVRCDFEWPKFAGQVRALVNYVGNSDAVVACLPGVLERLKLRWFNVGGAGAFGFTSATSPAAAGIAPAVRMKEYRYVLGGHGAAITEDFWPEIAQFALLGTHPPGRKDILRNQKTKLIFLFAPLLAIAGALIALSALLLPWIVGFFLVARFSSVANNSSAEIGVGIVVFSACLLLSWATARFIKRW